MKKLESVLNGYLGCGKSRYVAVFLQILQILFGLRSLILPRNRQKNIQPLEGNLASVSFLQKLTDDNKTRQWDGLLRKFTMKGWEETTIALENPIELVFSRMRSTKVPGLIIPPIQTGGQNEKLP